jgi:hypothetical protein
LDVHYRDPFLANLGNTARLKALHVSGKWTDLDIMVDSFKGGDGNTMALLRTRDSGGP